ncbi:NO-inducible flavohemoprotein [Deinococcus multiflagellatus]|uniref:nitric oxide dioxygenase n=1 Tax=Deinococcus multiflagellatus TaxID=1656887 RepID=A0ABW1ZT19_9DEIO|nr:NO-inducible flavohemoprotein [Deinococcus multiflagellatus]MBZ9713592.1 NO-inducible flavohemoprotein [Deinococcus multiflagellatus]
MLTPAQLAIIKATVPALEAHGETITRTFYASMFAAHPELLNIFNPANQQTGRQARSLAASVLAYAANIEHPERLGGMVTRIAHKHVSLEVLPEHYPVVGEHLLGAIAAVLGEAATPEILAAWAAAYEQLAGIMMGAEAQMYRSAEQAGWRGFKSFRVVRKVQESRLIASLELEPADDQPLPPFQPGQYLSLNLQVPGQTTRQIRQYSLVSAPNGRSYTIAVKRELAPAHDPLVPGGLISNALHDHVQEGDELLVHMPAGDFVLQPSARPAVLISGGVGITPMLGMLRALVAAGSARPVVFVHAALGRWAHAFREPVNELARTHSNIRKVVFYTEVTPDDRPGEHHDEAGLISLDRLRPYLPAGDAEYYYCGPEGFTQAVECILDALQVPAERRLTETFGPSQTFGPVLMPAGVTSSASGD